VRRRRLTLTTKAAPTPATAINAPPSAGPRARDVELDAIEGRDRRQLFASHELRKGRMPRRRLDRVAGRKRKGHRLQQLRRHQTGDRCARQCDRHAHYPCLGVQDELSPIDDVADGAAGQREEENVEVQTAVDDVPSISGSS
jgi:hypothetical protein